MRFIAYVQRSNPPFRMVHEFRCPLIRQRFIEQTAMSDHAEGVKTIVKCRDKPDKKNIPPQEEFDAGWWD